MLMHWPLLEVSDLPLMLMGSSDWTVSMDICVGQVRDRITVLYMAGL